MLLLSVVACDKYLDKDPDSRVTVDSADKSAEALGQCLSYLNPSGSCRIFLG